MNTNEQNEYAERIGSGRLCLFVFMPFIRGQLKKLRGLSGSGHEYTRMNELQKQEPVQDLDRLVEGVIGAAYEVSNTLGCGFLEKVYERALVAEMAARELHADRHVPFPVFYKGASLGTYFADLVVERRLIVELKCVETFTNVHLARCLNYLRAAQLKLALLINFQHPKMQWRRLIL